jgi:anaerobic nitric oxide reductase transcription regulator
LENVLSRAVLQAASRVERGATVFVDVSDLGGNLGTPQAQAAAVAEINAPAPGDRDLRTATDDFQRTLIRNAVAANGGNWAAAARSLGMQRSNLHHLAKRLGLR